MKKWRLILFPFAVLYAAVVQFRNFLFSIGVFKSQKFPFPIIIIGNLNTGGTGKSPMTDYIVKLFTYKKTAILSRGYGRKSKGFLEVLANANTNLTGDEPLMLKHLNDTSNVFVGEKRVNAINEIIKRENKTELIVLDDAYQHRWLNSNMKIVLTTYDNLFYNDFLLPVGTLREGRKNINRAQIIIVNKCPDVLDQNQIIHIKSKIKNYTNAPVFFTKLRYNSPIALWNNFPFNFSSVLLISGLANANALKQYCKSTFEHVESIDFNDHYDYTNKDFEQIAKKFDSFANSSKAILTTHKDAVKWMNKTGKEMEYFKSLPVFYLPVTIAFLDDEILFQSLVKNYVEQFKTNS